MDASPETAVPAPVAARRARVRGWGIARIVMALALVWAIWVQMMVAVDEAHEFDRDLGVVVANFFSFFTILSNSAAAVFLTWSAVIGLRSLHDGRRLEPRWLTTATVCAATYMVVTGIVYNILLRPLQDPISGGRWWSNEVVHLVGPVFVVIDLAVAPLRNRLQWRTVWTILAFPIVWIIYTLIRGGLITSPITGEAWWYPYAFLDHHVVPGGWWGVAAYIGCIAVLVGAIATGVVWTTRRFGHDGAATVVE